MKHDRTSSSSQDKTLLGLGQITTAAAFYGSMGMWSVMTMSAFGAFSQGWVKALIILVIVSAVGISKKQFRRPKKADLKWFALAAVASLNVVPYFFGFQLLGASMGTVAFNVGASVAGYICARIFFKEKITLLKILSLVIVLAGIITIYGLSVDQDILLGGSLMLLTGTMSAFMNVCNKKLGHYSATQQVFWSFFVIFIACLLLSFIFNDKVPAISNANWLPWVALIAYAGANIGSMNFRIASLRNLNVSIVVLVGLSEIIFGVLFGVIFLGELFSLRTAIGVFVIILGLALETVLLLIAKKRKL